MYCHVSDTLNLSQLLVTFFLICTIRCSTIVEFPRNLLPNSHPAISSQLPRLTMSTPIRFNYEHLLALWDAADDD